MKYTIQSFTGILSLIILFGLSTAASAQVSVSIPTIQGGVGEEITIDVMVDDLTGQDVFAYDFTLVYDEAFLNITGFESSGTRSQGASVIMNASKVDTVRVVAASATALSGSGTLIRLEATINAAGSTDLEFVRFVFNDGEPEAVTSDGRVSTVNQAPSAANVSVSTLEDTSVQITLSGTDPEGENLSFSITNSPSNGSLGSINVVNATSATVTYTPAANFAGSDSFTYSVSDGTSSSTGTVSVTVTAVDDAPGQATITSPESGSEFRAGGENESDLISGGTVLFTADWDAVTDPEGSQVTYTYQVASDASFIDLLEERAVGTQTSSDVTIAQAASWVDAIHGSAELGASATIYHRVLASDGTLTSIGDASTVVLVRGTITAREGGGELPGEFELQGNYPNPFNPSTSIRFDLPAPAEVTVELSDAVGRRVLLLPSRQLPAGAGQAISVDASNLVSGTYLYRVTARFGDATVVRSSTMTLLR